MVKCCGSGVVGIGGGGGGLVRGVVGGGFGRGTECQ